jgi:hypothetical protein
MLFFIYVKVVTINVVNNANFYILRLMLSAGTVTKKRGFQSDHNKRRRLYLNLDC